MKTSCLRHPESSIYLQLHSWMFELCQGNQCAALLLAYFSGWHDWKLDNDHYYKRFNDIAETHGDGRPYVENAYLFFTNEELIAGIMGLYGKKAINEALDFLVSLGIISIHNNPNPRYHFDKTKYFRFYANVCNEWIAENYPVISNHRKKNKSQPIDSTDGAKSPYGKGEKDRIPSKNTRPAGESNRAITNTTNNTTNKNQPLNARNDFSNNDETKCIIDALVEKGMSCKHFHYPDVTPTIERLMTKGATVETFLEAYDLASASANNGFGMRYLAKTVENLLLKTNKRKAYPSHSPYTPVLDEGEEVCDTNDWKNLEWMEEGCDDVK